MAYEQNWDPLGNARDGIDALRTMNHLSNQEKQNALLAEQVRLQKEALELEKKKLAQEQEKINLERERLKQQGQGQGQQAPPTPAEPPKAPYRAYTEEAEREIREGKRPRDRIAAIENATDPRAKQRLLQRYEFYHGPLRACLRLFWNYIFVSCVPEVVFALLRCKSDGLRSGTIPPGQSPPTWFPV